MKVVITNDRHPQSSLGVALVTATSLLPADQPGTKTWSLVTWMLISPHIPQGKLMHYLHICKHWRDFCAHDLHPASGSAHLWPLRHKQILQKLCSRISVDALNTGSSLISSLLKIMHMLFLIMLRNLASVLLPWTAPQ